MKKWLIFLLIFWPCFCFAHRLMVFAEPESGRVSVYAYFSSGTPAKNAEVRVYREKKLVVSGKTDANGVFYFSPELAGTYRVVVTALGGHRAEATVEVEKTGEETEAFSCSSELNRLEGEIKSIHEELVRIRMEMQRVKLKDVLGGIGWILGIFGAAAFVFSRKKT